jgi:anti-sigma factor RsiW
LSAYLDGDLDPREAARLQARLESEPELRLSLDEMRQVATAVRGLGEVRVPRNFTLRAADAVRRREPGFAYLRFATVLATALFVLTTAVRTLSVVPLQFGAAAPVAESATTAALEMFADIAGAALPTSEAPLEAEAPPPAAAAIPVPVGTATPAPTLGGDVVPSPAPSATGCPSCAPSLAYRQEADDQAGKTTETDEEEIARVAQIPGGPTGALAVAQWVLAVVVVVLGVLTLRARRRR